ncbi:MAG: MBL fold metallo-hydrolase [Acidobacteriota bacterium]
MLDFKTHGLSLVLQTPSGKTWLLDTGLDQKGEYYAARDTIVPFLKAAGVKAIDGVLISHPHSDHFGGLVHILDNFPVGQLVDAGYAEIGGSELETYRKIREQYVAGGGESVIVRQGAKITIDPVLDAEVIWPPEGLYRPDPEKKDSALYNSNSIVLRVRHGANVFLFPGDNHGIAKLPASVGADKLRCDVLIAPHHGLNSTPAMATATRPKIVVVASLKEYLNPTIHPFELTSDAFTPGGAEVYATWAHGDITIMSDGRTLKTTTARKP